MGREKEIKQIHQFYIIICIILYILLMFTLFQAHSAEKRVMQFCDTRIKIMQDNYEITGEFNTLVGGKNNEQDNEIYWNNS